MPTEVKVPGFPESVNDGTITTWYKKPGDPVVRDEIIADIETDKVVFEIPAPNDGVLEEILQAEGATVVSHQLIALLGAEVAGKVAEPTSITEKSMAEKTVESPDTPATEEIVTLSARKLIEERGLDLKDITGTGKDGRILKEDVLLYMEQQLSGPTYPSQSSSADNIDMDADRPEKRVPMTRLRRRIAERLVEVQQSAAILTTFNEVNMQPVMDLRSKYRDRFEKSYGVRLGFMSFFIKAVVEGLKQFPELNASIDGNEIIYHGYYDVGVAVGSPRGLVVPIVRDVDQLAMADIEKQIMEFGQKAQDGKLSIEEITGGTFSITNGGVFGSLLSTPILNPPQSAILGMHKIQQRPVVENGEIVICPMMYLALSYDHRIIDGREAVQFLVTVKNMLEDPARMLLNV